MNYPAPVITPTGRVNLSHTRASGLTRFWFGAPYYPEHWSAEERAGDVALMQQAGVNMVRMAEFAWDLMEPEEGLFEFSLFDETIEKLGQAGIKTMLCTPTATPPRWLTLAHPEILRVDARGMPMAHGSRQHCCHTHPLFREYSRKITRVMAEHFKDNPHVVAWQTDNEINCHFSETYSESAGLLFQSFLREKFNGNIDALNRTWGTAFWAQTYRSFKEIPLPRKMSPTYVNPAHWLDYKRFISYSVTLFQHEQIVILRETNPAWFIIHNGTMQDIDYRGDFVRDLDIYGHDSYPLFTIDPVNRQPDTAFNLDRVRSFSGNFFIPEHQGGAGGQEPYMLPTPEPGEMRLLSYQAIGRGADSILYFRWRTCRFGAEEYWCGIINHDNKPRRRYEEFKQLGEEFHKLEKFLPGTTVNIDCAVAAWDFDVKAGDEVLKLGIQDSAHYAQEVHQWLYRHGYNVGCVHPEDDLSGLKLLVIPHWTLFDPAWVSGLEDFVINGGLLVIGARTATRDKNNNVVPETPPGALRKLAGVTVEDFGRVHEGGRNYGISFHGNNILTVEGWYEQLAPDPDTEILAQWSDRFLQGSPAITRKKHGKGEVIYVGTCLSEAINRHIFLTILEDSHLQPLRDPASASLEVNIRQGNGYSLWIYLNHSVDENAECRLRGGFDILKGKTIPGGLCHLEPFGVRVIRVEEDNKE